MNPASALGKASFLTALYYLGEVHLDLKEHPYCKVWDQEPLQALIKGVSAVSHQIEKWMKNPVQSITSRSVFEVPALYRKVSIKNSGYPDGFLLFYDKCAHIRTKLNITLASLIASVALFSYLWWRG